METLLVMKEKCMTYQSSERSDGYKVPLLDGSAFGLCLFLGKVESLKIAFFAILAVRATVSRQDWLKLWFCQ